MSASTLLPTFAFATLGTVTILLVALMGMSQLGPLVGPGRAGGQGVTSPRVTVTIAPPVDPVLPTSYREPRDGTVGPAVTSAADPRVAPNEVGPTDLAPADVAPTDLAPPDVAPAIAPAVLPNPPVLGEAPASQSEDKARHAAKPGRAAKSVEAIRTLSPARIARIAKSLSATKAPKSEKPVMAAKAVKRSKAVTASEALNPAAATKPATAVTASKALNADHSGDHAGEGSHKPHLI